MSSENPSGSGTLEEKRRSFSALLAKLEDMDFSDICGHQGFDPSKMRRTVMENPEYEQNDVLTMCKFFFTRGTNLENIKRRISEMDQRVLDTLIQRYSLVSKANAGDSGSSRTRITLARIAACFPDLSVSFLDDSSTISVRRPVSLAEMGEMLGVSSFPQVLTTNIVLSIIPRDKNIINPADTNKIYVIVMTYAAQEVCVINPAMASKKLLERFHHNRPFAVAAYNSTLFSNEERFKIASRVKGVFYVEDGSLRLLDHINEVYDSCVSYMEEREITPITPLWDKRRHVYVE
ncbi:unnamed protein product [Phyllotreta striolata]|uniref:Uncharacterized protein n=1 Tax=Phyllotreta striolata TaxID=444603 RepID=A0A9P0DN92_PHYSR|nr:unnamed protein product [Phyllotreta striolata]